MKAAVVTFALATTAFALPAAAQLNASSVYIGASAGRANYRAPSETDMAWRFFGGYQFHRNFAVEAGYHNLGEVNFVQGDRSSQVFELTGVGLFPVANALSVYGKVGAYYGKSEVRSSVIPSGDDTNGGLTYGVGAQYDISPQVGARLEWQRYDQVGGSRTGETDIDVMNVGLVYRFR